MNWQDITVNWSILLTIYKENYLACYTIIICSKLTINFRTRHYITCCFCFFPLVKKRNLQKLIMDPALLKAVTEDNLQQLNLILATPKILLSRTPEQNTALHIAAHHGHHQFARRILRESEELILWKEHRRWHTSTYT